MTDLRITDAPEVATITGAEKIPTGNSGGNFAISVDSLAQYVKDSKDLQSDAEVEATVAPVEMEIATHVADLENPHQVTKEQVGLGNVDNTADTDKPISSAVAAAITTLTTNKADKTYVDSQLALKANQLTTYTKTDVDNLLATKANQSTTYTKTEVNTFLTNKQERLSVDGTLTGSRSFDTVPKLDGLDGNPSPIMNQQAQALMNRTESLNYDISTMLNYYDSSFSVSVGGYPLNSRVVLSDGTLVRSNISNNTNNPNTDMTGWELALPDVNTEGTYTKVTTDKYGRVVSGENPNTLAGIGITNAYTKTEVDNAISSSVPVVVDATTVDKGIVRLATESDITNSSENVALTPKNVNDMLIGVGASAKGFRALLSARLTQMTGTNISSGKTITCTITAHGLSVGDVIRVSYRYAYFTENRQATDVVTVTSVTNANTFVFTSPQDAVSTSTEGTCTVSYVIKNNYNVNSLTINAVGQYTISINTASGITGTSFIPFIQATTTDNSLVIVQPEAITSATSLTVRTFNAVGAAITPQWLHIGVTQ